MSASHSLTGFKNNKNFRFNICSMSVGTVKSRLYHARIKLKKLLSPYFFEGEWNLHADSTESEDCVSTL